MAQPGGAHHGAAHRLSPCAPEEEAIGTQDGDAAPLEQLIAASARGDEQAFHRLYRATCDALYGVALRMLRRRDWAEEVLQESFISIWRHAARYDRGKGAPMTWMIRIVRNQALDWIGPTRPDGFERLHGSPFEDFDVVAHAGERDAIDKARRAERIAGCIEALDAKQRQSIALVFFHGMSHGDLALHLRAPLGTVKAWVRRGIERLRLCLAG